MCPVVAGTGGSFKPQKGRSNGIEQKKLTKSCDVQCPHSIKGDVHSPFLPSIPLATAFLNVNYFHDAQEYITENITEQDDDNLLTEQDDVPQKTSR